MERRFDVFLSYNRRDLPAAQALAEVLRERGLRVWFDDWILAGGSDWQREMERGIERSRAVVVAMGESGLGPWEAEEVRAALIECVSRGLVVIPALLAGAPQAPALPLFLRTRTWVDLRDGPAGAGLARLLRGIPKRRRSPAAAAPAPAAVLGDRLAPYLGRLIDRTRFLDIRGIAPTRSSREALRSPIEQLYTPLRSRDEPRPDGQAAFALERCGTSGLADLLPRYARLLIEGPPGAGKTTFLHFVACLLARDALGIAGPGGEPWRCRYLGMAEGSLPLPVLLRVSDLVPVLEAGSRLRRDDRGRLLDVLEETSRVNGEGVDRASWEALLAGSGAVLLLDGLDEVAEERLRERVFAVFRDAVDNWGCRMVVTSRPLQTAALRSLGFHLAVVEPFGAAEIHTFLDHWVAALWEARDAAALHGEGERYRQDLEAAICGRPGIGKLATNPVMLTCLCVIHWNERRLPEGRALVYQAVVHWLLASRREQRAAQGFPERFAERALARLALAMTDDRRGKQTVCDLSLAVAAVDAVFERQFPELAAEDRRHRAGEWLDFEASWAAA